MSTLNSGRESPDEKSEEGEDNIAEITEGFGVRLPDKLLRATKERVLCKTADEGVSGGSSGSAFVDLWGFCGFWGLVDHSLKNERVKGGR